MTNSLGFFFVLFSMFVFLVPNFVVVVSLRLSKLLSEFHTFCLEHFMGSPCGLFLRVFVLPSPTSNIMVVVQSESALTRFENRGFFPLSLSPPPKGFMILIFYQNFSPLRFFFLSNFILFFFTFPRNERKVKLKRKCMRDG